MKLNANLFIFIIILFACACSDNIKKGQYEIHFQGDKKKIAIMLIDNSSSMSEIAKMAGVYNNCEKAVVNISDLQHGNTRSEGTITVVKKEWESYFVVSGARIHFFP